MSDQQLVEDIRATRDYIVKHGWCQKDLSDDDGRVCLQGAQELALPSFARRWNVDKFLEQGIAIELGFTVDQLRAEAADHNNLAPVPYYNDFKLSDIQDVLNFLDKQAIRAEEKA